MKRLASVAAALTALATGLLINSPVAGAKAGPVLATYKVTPGFYTLATGLNAVWALDGDEYHDAVLYRIDPQSHGMKLVTTLPFAGASLEVAFGSVWVSDYFGNEVWRLASNGHVQSEIGVGLQPQWLHAAFGSLWVSNHHGASVSRIDPTTNTVLDTVQIGAPDTFRSGPQDMTDDGTKLYAASSNLQSLQSVDPSNDVVSTGPSVDDAFCGPLAAAGGFIWSADGCTGAFYQLGTDGSEQQVIPSTGVPGGVTLLGNQLWISDDTTFDPDTFQGSDAVVQQLDPATGAVLRTVTIGGDATYVRSGFGDLWVWDANASTIRRVSV
jgi:hypothetical protein